MVVVRRRLIFWLIRAYIKKSSKSLIFFFFLGLLIFFTVLFSSRYLVKLIPVQRKPVIGMVGSYTQDNLPPVVLSKLSRGLTKVENDASVVPDIAESWDIKDAGKTYIFRLRPDQAFNNRTKITSNTLFYNFSDVEIERPQEDIVIFKLKDAYSPFLTTVSKPVFGKGFSGAGEYNLADVELNGDFVQSLTLSQKKNKFDTMKYLFYPSEDALKTAYLMGEITQADGVTDLKVKNTSFDKFSGTEVTKEVDYTQVVALFYNNNDSNLSDKKMRLALGYGLPDNFFYGKKAYLPYPPTSIYYNTELEERKQDLEHARLLLPDPPPDLTITTLKKYTPAAKQIAEEWKKVGIKTKIEEVDSVPNRFQIFLGDFTIPRDPDQYTLWHSAQPNNITKFKNLRVDKLLEDGRKIDNHSERQKIYNDFQKYLLEDAPATFLYYPYKYEITRD